MQTPEQAALLQLLGIHLLQCQHSTVVSDAAASQHVTPANSPELTNSPERVNSLEPVNSPAQPSDSGSIAVSSVVATPSVPAAAVPVPASPLQQDVLFALAQLGLTASWQQQIGVSWQLNATGLLTEPVAQFADGRAKRALWQLLCQHAAAVLSDDMSADMLLDLPAELSTTAGA